MGNLVFKFFPNRAEDIQSDSFDIISLSIMLHITWDDVHITWLKQFDFAIYTHFQLPLDYDPSLLVGVGVHRDQCVSIYFNQ